MIRSAIPIAGLALALMLASAAVHAQGSGSVEGVVVATGSSTPVPRALVRLETTGGQDVAEATASVDGHFELPSVAPGEYRILARQAGFASNGRGSQVTVVAGRKTDVSLGIFPLGAISGRIVDWDGLPVVGVHVQALKLIGGFLGRHLLGTGGSAETNDLGEYRIYWIQPGKYIVRADPGDYGTRARDVRLQKESPSPQPKPQQYVATYFPSVADPASARLIDFRAGEMLSGADIRLVESRKHRVSGVVSISSNRHSTDIQLTPRNPATDMCDYLTSADRTGLFSFENVVPGSYILTANAFNEDGVNTFGRISIDLGNVDVGNLSMVLGPGFDLGIRLTIEGRLRRSDDPQLVVNLRPEISSTPSPTVERNGENELTMHRFMPGDYSVAVLSLTNARGPNGSPVNGRLYLKSAQYGGADVLTTGLHVEAQPSGILDIVMADGAGTISGKLVDDRKQPVVGTTVVLIPIPRLRGRTDLYKWALTDRMGNFEISGIPPGPYKVFSWEAATEVDWQNPEFMESYEDRGQPVRIDAGKTDPITIQLIPPR